MSPSLTERVLDIACAIQQIPAPTFHEHKRGEFVRQQFAALGLQDVSMDDLGNVYARRPGLGQTRPILVSAHTDTVFPAETPLTLERTAERISGPGLGDNALGVAGLFGLAWALDNAPLPGDVWLVANVCEEGLGDLRGMRAVMQRLGQHVKATIVLEGMALGQIYHGGIGVRRYRFITRAEGGHSWLNFGRPSAIHALMQFGAQVAQLTVPSAPRTTYNIGTVQGGTSVNTIAREASFDLDLRSEDPAALQDLAARVEKLAAEHQTPGITLETHVIGDRPSGMIARQHPLVQMAARAFQEAGVTPHFDTGSTDANIPLSLGLPCVCVGLSHGGNAHRPDEYIETAPLNIGLTALQNLTRYALAWGG